MANLKPEIMQKFKSILESRNEEILSILKAHGWGNAKTLINVNADLYANPEASSPAADRIDRIFITPRMSRILRVRVSVTDKISISHVRKCMGSVVPRVTAGPEGIDQLGKPYVEFEASLPTSFMTSKTPEQDFMSFVKPVITALEKVYQP